MASSGQTDKESDAVAMLKDISSTLKKMQQDHAQLAANVETIQSRVDMSNSFSQFRSQTQARNSIPDNSPSLDPKEIAKHASGLSSSPPPSSLLGEAALGKPIPAAHARKSSITSRIILTTYPGQSGIDPIPLEWGRSTG